MKSFRTKSFKSLFGALSDETKRQANTAYRLFQQDPYHPSLHFKQVDPSDPSVYSVRVGRSWRPLGRRQNDTIYWFWVGSHEDYTHLM